MSPGKHAFLFNNSLAFLTVWIETMFFLVVNSTQWWYMTTCHHPSCRSDVSQLMTPLQSGPEEKRFAAKSCPGQCPAPGMWPHLKISSPQRCTHLTTQIHSFLLQRHCQTAVQAGTCSADKLSCLGQAGGFYYSCASQMGRQISGRLRKWDFDFQTTYWLLSWHATQIYGLGLAAQNLPWSAGSANRQLNRSASDKMCSFR